MQQNLQNKKGLVENVFNQVYNKYDLMNDFMSMGIHSCLLYTSDAADEP